VPLPATDAATNVARWSGTSWSAYGTGVTAPVQQLDQLATGELLAYGGHASSVAMVWNGLFWSSIPTGAMGSTVGATVLPNGGVALATSADDLRGAVAVCATPPNGNASGYRLWGLGAATIAGAIVTPNGDIALYGDLWAHGSLTGGIVTLDTGCSGASPPAFAARTLPWLGSTYRARATGLSPAAIAFEVLGLQTANVVLSSVVAQAMPGCTLLMVPDATNLHLPVAGAVDVQLAIPVNPSLVGLTLRHQIVQVEFDPLGALGAVSASPALLPRLGTY